MIPLEIVRHGGMSPQQMMESAVGLEGEMYRLAIEVGGGTLSTRGRIDGLARLATAAEGVQILVGEILRLTEPEPESLPFREDFFEWLQLCLNRTTALRALAEIARDRLDGSIGLTMNAAPIVEQTEAIVAGIVEKLQALAAAKHVGEALRGLVA